MAIITSAAFAALAAVCAPTVHPKTLYSIVHAESRFNEFAIGVVGKPLARQPESLNEAIGLVEELVSQDRNFSIGLGQINRYNFDISKPELVFDRCTNLKLTAQILERCYSRFKEPGDTEQQAILKGISCYYSGKKDTGFKPEPQFGNTSHVERVLASAEGYSIGAIESGEEVRAPKQAPEVGPAMRPVYRSWDVLRQYPTYVPITDAVTLPQGQVKQDLNSITEHLNEDAASMVH